ncbi:hypothetical protein SAMN04488156_102660 [Bacillus sp. 166amftsu]|nr:hypothetical protein SAMN04488156_102660 [Bacillus sp. 166amftsu]
MIPGIKEEPLENAIAPLEIRVQASLKKVSMFLSFKTSTRKILIGGDVLWR